MLCKNCGLRPATTHVKRVINGRVEEYHLCSECANKLNVSVYDAIDLSELWGAFFGDRLPNSVTTNQKKCNSCGSTFAEIARLGKLGCADCYSMFCDELLPSLRKMHGKTRHVGKVPNNIDKQTQNSYKIAELKKKLEEAVESENYEDAAKFRDEIKLIENQNSSSEDMVTSEQSKAGDDNE